MELLDLFLRSSGVSTDTRKIEANNIFFALKGTNFNGNLYAEMALESGASYAVIDEVHFEKNNKFILVDDVLKSLQKLALEYRNTLTIPVLAITGSNGKTTSKELLASALTKKFKTHYTKGNLNNEIGVPLTILSTPAETEFLIVEMGANHQGEIALLSEITNPNFGLITNIGKAHLEGFGGIEGVKKGKGELYHYLAKSNGKIFLNTDDETLSHMVPLGCELIKYRSSDFKIVEDFPFIKLYKDKLSIATQLAGTYNLNNIASTYAIASYFGVSDDQITQAIENYFPSNNRSQIIDQNGVRIIKDAYNANPSSVTSSLHSFLNADTQNKIVILGDMLELGEYANEEHMAVLSYLVTKDIFKAILIGPIYKHLQNKFPSFTFFTNIEEAKNKVEFKNFIGKTILLKGSRGIALEKLLD